MPKANIASGSCTPHPSKPNVYVDRDYVPVLSAWIVVTEAEQNVHLQPRVCFPRRICTSIGKPITPTTNAPLCTASCVLDIGGKLYVISSVPEVAASSVDGTRNGEIWDDTVSRRPGHNLTECVRLGRVVYQAAESSFLVIEVADTFRACRDRDYSECSIPLNNNWLASRPGPRSGEAVKLLPLQGPPNEAQALLSGYFIDLSYLPGNEYQASFEHYNLHEGRLTRFNGSDQLDLIDSGSLVVSEGQHIGIANVLIPSQDFGQVLLFDDKLWAFFVRRSNVFKHLGKRTGPVTVTRVWKHLEYRV
ncbi:hypothetical protein F4823DRAFT_630661 [Ustulina deusta]|nr:hypothetical protein F4823DRAFT_630661 [Ustulina deusta]